MSGPHTWTPPHEDHPQSTCRNAESGHPSPRYDPMLTRANGEVQSGLRSAQGVLSRLRPHRPAIKAFTLLELLVVLVIIGLLAAYVGPKYIAQIGKSEQSSARAQVEALAKALDSYRIDVGTYPPQNPGLQALNAAPANDPRWKGPYLQKPVPLDPWGRPFIYTVTSNGSDFDLKSLGKDGLPGGNADDADISFR